MCYEQGELQAYLDSEHPEEKMSEIETHLKSCIECQGIMAGMKATSRSVASVMEGYGPAVDGIYPNTDNAWQRLAHKDEKRGRHRILKGVGFMNKRIAVALPAIAMIAILLSFGGVRTGLANFLHIFRVDKVETVSFTYQDVTKLEQAMREGGTNMDIESLGKISVEGSEQTNVVTREGAQKTVDFALKIPAKVLTSSSKYYFGEPGFKTQSAMKINLTIDVAKVNAMIAALGSDKPLPESIDGETVTLSIPALVTAEYPASVEGVKPLTIAQGRSPELTVSADVDVMEVRDSLLGIEMLPDSLKKKLAAVNDWQHTLLVPNIEGSTKEVDVNGHGGVYITPEGGQGTILIWPADGIINVIQGDLSLDGATGIATQMK